MDYSDSLAVSERLTKATAKLHTMAPAVGMARQVKEFNSDMRKSALSLCVVKYLKADESATAAEHLARADGKYIAELAQLAETYKQAESTLAQWQAELCSFEAARSLLSFNKETTKNLLG